MVANVTLTNRAGNRYVLAYRRDDDGNFVNIDGTAPAAGDADGTGGGYELYMPQDFPLTLPEPDDIVIDSEVATVSLGNLIGGQARIRFTATISTFDLTFQNEIQGTTLVNDGAYTTVALAPQDPQVPTWMLTQQNYAKVFAGSGVTGQRVCTLRALFNATVTFLESSSITMRTEQIGQYLVEADSFRYTPLGETVKTYGTCGVVGYAGDFPYFVDFVRFTGDGAETTFNLPRTMPTAAIAGTHVHVSVDRNRQTATTDYTIDTATNTVTFEAGAIPANGSVINVWYPWVIDC